MTDDQRQRLERLADPHAFNITKENAAAVRAALRDLEAAKRVINAARKVASDGSNRHKLAPALAEYDQTVKGK